MRALALALACLLLVIAPATAAAEINMADAIEWIAVDSDVVVRGKVTAVSRRNGPGERVWYEVTLKVTETLKGPPRRSVTVAVPSPLGGKARRRELLLFLDAGAEPGAAIELRRGDGAALVLDGPSPDRAYSSTFAVLDRRADILAAARAGATSTATISHRLDVPYDAPAFQALYAGSAVWMTVPVDARLEQLALSWVTATDVSTREEGVGALAHFRTPASIVIVERLLADPGFAVVQESGKPPVKRFLVRARAHQVLEAWGVQHATPPIDVPHAP